MSTAKFDIILPPQDIVVMPGLLNRLADGDREAFAWVYKNYCKKVYSYALLVTSNETISEDIVQEVFIRLWKFRDKLAAVNDFNAFLYTLYRNEVIDVLRKGQREKKLFADFRNAVIDSETSVDDFILHKCLEQQIVVTIAELPAKQQQVFILRENGIKRPAIAKMMGSTENKVKGYLTRALAELKKKLNRNY